MTLRTPYGRRSATVIAAPSGTTSLAKLAQEPGEPTAKWVVLEDTGDLYRWVPHDTSTADGFNVVNPTGGGTAGRFIRVVANRFGADLGDADATITVADGLVRVLPSVPLTDNRSLTLGTAGAIAGDTIRIVRNDTAAFTVTVKNGLDASTIAVLDAATEQWIECKYRSAAVGWIQTGAGALL
jgi:hypothetical protein